jgi:diguanylate cyclase (GGDEF)-like protein
MTILLLQSAVLAARAVTAGAGGADAAMFTPSPMQSIYIASYPIMMVALSIGVFLLATERMRGDLEYLATHDVMTGTLNRRAIVETAERELARCRRHGHVMSLLMMDLDHFKKINDTYGHLVGDRVLKDFAGQVSALLRLPDQFGRYGGEEFVLLLPDTGREAAAIVADRICKAAAEAKAPMCTVSIGLATATLIDTGIDSLLARADEALYRAKAGGRNQVATAPLLQEVPSPEPAVARLRPVA